MKTKILLFVAMFICIVNVKAQNKDEFKNKGFFNITQFSYINNYYAYLEAGSIAGELDTDKSRAYSLQNIFGYFIIPESLSVGVGIGLDGYHTPDFNTLPIFLDARYYFTKKKNSPFSYLDFGTFVRLDDTFERGYMARIGAGYKFFITKKTCVIVDFAYAFKGVSLIDEPYSTSDNTLVVRGFALNIGFVF